jgi:hypothetical protein
MKNFVGLQKIYKKKVSEVFTPKPPAEKNVITKVVL